MIEAKGLSFSYGKRKIADEIELCIKEGELCALLGKNGAGKTTLLRLLSSLEHPSEGELLLDGKPYSSYQGREFAKRVGFFAQTRPVPKMCVFDYVAYGRYPHSNLLFKLSQNDKEAIEKALIATGTKELCERDLSTLSGGERRLVYLAQLIAQGAPHLLLDEPTAFADVKNSFLVADILAAQVREGKCAVAVMHDIALALSCFFRIIILDGGRIVADGTPDSIVQSGKIEQVFGVKCEKADDGYVLKKP